MISAIERDRSEVLVAPLRQRLASRFAANAPEISGRLTGRQAVKISGEVAAAQQSKR